jgi:hypothetical protein
LFEHLEHLHETNDLFGNVAKSQNLRQMNVRPVQIRFFKLANLASAGAFGDPKSPGNKPSNEGHGFSRAVNSRRSTASAAEVRFFQSYRGKVISFASEFFFNATRERVAI